MLWGSGTGCSGAVGATGTAGAVGQLVHLIL